MAKRKGVLNAALKALLAGAETSAAIKIPATFISELAALPNDKQKVLAELSHEQFNQLLTQSELATINAAESTAGTKQIKALVQKFDDKATEMLKDIREDVKYIRESLSDIPKTKVTIFLEGNVVKFKKCQKQLFIDTLASILQVKANQIRILKVSEGSIQIMLEMPKETAELLLSLFLAGDENVAKLNIKKVLIQKKVEFSSTKEKKTEDAIRSYLSELRYDIRVSLWKDWDIFAIPITISPGNVTFDSIDVIRHIEDKMVVLHGKPACGKTTAVERIMVTAKDQSDLIPVRLFVADNASKLRDRISNKLGRATCKELEEQGRFLFIFDGLNEQPEMEKVAENIRLLSNDLSSSKFLVTCRSYEYKTHVQDILYKFIPYKIEDLSWDDQKRFIERRIHNKLQNKKLLFAFENHPELKKVCANQFTFLMAVDAVPRAKIPPRLSSDLYELFLQKFLGLWEKIQDIEAKKVILEEIAWAMTYSDNVNKVLLDQEGIRKEMGKAGVDNPRKSLDDLLKLGLLEKRDYSVVFSQETFEEFLVASWLIRKGVFPKHFTKDEKTGCLHYKGLKISKLTKQFYLELGGIPDHIWQEAMHTVTEKMGELK